MGFNKNVMLVMLFSVIFIPSIYAGVANSFDIDQLLIRIQLKENESIEKSIKITNIGLSDIDVNANVEGLDSVVLLNKNSIKLRSGTSDSIDLKVIGIRKGVFIGKLILSSKQETKEIPIIIEIESKNVLIDASINPSITGKIYPGSRFSFDISLINLMNVESASVVINYEVKDFDNNKILEESENIVVSKRASFIKTFKIPSNVKIASYVLIAKANYEDSLGTTTYIFDVEKKDASNLLNDLCENNIICKVLPMIFALVFFVLLLIIVKNLSRKKPVSPRKMERIAAEKAKIQQKLDSLVEGYKSGFISKESYEKSRKKLKALMKNLNK